LEGMDPVQRRLHESEEQILVMNTERLLPELLFHPSDIGINQAGIAEAIVQSVNEAAPGLHALLYRNIVLCGGSVLFPGFKERLYNDLRSLVPAEMELNIHMPRDPICSPWRGGSKFMRHPGFPYYSVTRDEYNEQGAMLATKRFNTI